MKNGQYKLPPSLRGSWGGEQTGSAPNRSLLGMYFSKLSIIAFLHCIFVLLFLVSTSLLHAQELPPVNPSAQTIATGSYLIPLDEAKQSVNIFDAATGLSFSGLNLSAYGLVYHLLQNQIPVKWVILTPKGKDAPDFSANVTRVFPLAQPPATESFISSAFVIDLADINGAVCNPQNTPQLPDVATLIANFGNNVAVYRLNNTASLNVRYTLRYPPQIGIMNNAGSNFADFAQTFDAANIPYALLSNADFIANSASLNVRYTLRYPPQIGIMNNAGSNFADFAQTFDAANIPYALLSNADFIANSACYTYILQPNATAGLNVTGAFVPTVNSFLSGGGNLWVQSEMALGLENSGFIMSTAGLTQLNPIINPPYSYLGNNLPVMQFEGSFPSGVSGSLGTFSLLPGSSWRPITFTYMLVTSPVGVNQIFMTGADVNATSAGGNLYYCGGDAFTLSAVPSGVATAGQVIQAQRLFLNAAFIPAGINYVCAGNDVCICADNSVTLGCTTGGSLGIGDVVWSPSAGLSCTDCPNPVASPAVTTTYTVTSILSGCNVSDQVTVTVIQEKPQVSNIKLTCNPSKTAFTVSFTISGGDAASYNVTGNTGTLNGNEFISDPILNSVPYSFAVSDSYHCETIVSGSYNCQLCLPTATLSGGGSACIDDIGGGLLLPITLTGQAPWQINYAINGITQTPVVATTATNFAINATQSGVYSLVSVEDAFCLGITSGTAAVSVTPVPLLELGQDITLCQGQTITLQANIPNGSYLWQDGSTGATYTTAVSGVYYLQATHECGILTDSVRVTVENCLPPVCKPIVPTAFSPNADGVNDFFKPVFNCEVSFFFFQIFDRWGRQVYESTDPTTGWNGTYKNETLPLGLYVWKLTYQFAEDADDPPRIAKGNVALLW
ncbi:MAG TPA: gliding motility-associated C-terminal domain-containing protein [Chitinophagales bacterium]|nr:gliding motility-associated C-terminal domain-containing protein [Chitinophagales bacterium]